MLPNKARGQDESVRSFARPDLEIVDDPRHPFDLLRQGCCTLFHGLTVDRAAEAHGTSAGVHIIMRVNVAACSAASFAFTAVVIDASSTFCPTVLPARESHPPRMMVKNATTSMECVRKCITVTALSLK